MAWIFKRVSHLEDQKAKEAFVCICTTVLRLLAALEQTGAELAWHALQLEERGESFYNPFLAPLVAELAGQGIIEDSNGAKV